MSQTPAPERSPHWPLQVVQNCYVVADLEQACRRLNRLYGIGPFLGGGAAVLDHHVHRGRPAPPIELRGVFVQSGDLNIELVQLLSTTPSAFRDPFVADGFEVASEFTVSFGAQICYIDARPALGHMIELYPESGIIRGMYQQARDAARDWDGRDLIIPWS
jgi:hypothetical protein